MNAGRRGPYGGGQGGGYPVRGHGSGNTYRGPRGPPTRYGDGAGAGDNFPPHHRGRGGGGMQRGHRRAGGQGVAMKLIKLKQQSDDDVLLSLIDPNLQFVEFLNKGNDIAVYELPNIFRVLAKASSCDTSPHLTLKLFQDVLHSHLFTSKVQSFFTTEIWKIGGQLDAAVVQQLLVDICKVMLATYVQLENHSHELLYNLVCVMESTLRRLETSRSPNMSPLVRETFDELQDISSSIVDRIMNLSIADKPSHVAASQGNPLMTPEDNRKPPEDFRSLTVQPTRDELRDAEKATVFLRSNLKCGRYEDANHYLDVQFRLTKEDFVAPLREGINKYLFEQLHGFDQRSRNTDIRLYKDAKVWHPVSSNVGIVHIVQFDIAPFRKVNWDASKRFIFGSLLVLSSDNFETLFFAVVVDRKSEDLQKGLITLRFLQDIPPSHVSHIMVESTVYFEAYRHVLGRLQKMNADPEKFPMFDYLVRCKRNVKPPLYLARNTGLVYDMKVIAENSGDLAAAPIAIRPMADRVKWPHMDVLGVDSSQMAALKTCLTKEIVLIQGPPGTGKTYIGLKIVKVLVQCVQSQFEEFGPILVVCFTNHALDQFLEGIENFLPGKGIVRVGGRSKSATMEQYSLNYLRKQMIDSRQVPREIFSLMGKINAELRELAAELPQIRAQIETSYNRVTEFGSLCGLMSQHHEKCLPAKLRNRKNHVIRSWLLNEVENDFMDPDEDYAIGDIVDLVVYEELVSSVMLIVSQIRNNQFDDDEINVEDEVAWETDRRILEDDEYHNIDEGRRKLNAVLLNVQNDDENDLFHDGDWQTQISRKQKNRLIQRKLRQENAMTDAEAALIDDPWDLFIEDRWRLYLYWVLQFRDRLYKLSKKREDTYNQLSEQKIELRQEEDMVVMKKSKILGITTTGAARYGYILSKLKCKIVIVEEAAEVLESHVIASLSPGLQHLILIGDHKQLKPSAAVFRLSKDFGLDLSLFERMINNKLQCDMLAHQHRMRPEIARIMRFIYENLQNHESVEHYDNIQGVSSNVFFFNHTNLEERANEALSYSNRFEAEFAVALCRHFLLNGYKPHQITILTLYSGQLFLFRTMMPKHVFEGVRVCVVDNYQGEENDIIILSLVRSNEHGIIGFLNIDNRVCVALSRAKMGLFVFGNFELLSSKNELWHKIVNDLNSSRQLGTSLSLKCQNHPDQPGAEISNPDDFKRVPEGGCDKICGQRLNCGHACPKMCHPTDREHTNLKCQKSCERRCPNKHECKRKCYQTCDKCLIPVQKIIPLCRHRQMVPCSINVGNFQCAERCTKIMLCGHRCSKKCGEACSLESSCQYPIQHTKWFCGHTVNVPCGVDKDKYPCPNPCEKPLPCGHICRGTCGTCANGRLHTNCRQKCGKTLICGHVCKEPCPEVCPPCNGRCEDACEHNKCPQRCGEPCTPCYEACTWKCPHIVCNERCSSECKRNPCNKPCQKKPRCNRCMENHQCIGLCGEKCPQLCPKCDGEKLIEIMVMYASEAEDDTARFITLQSCYHTFEVTSLDRWMTIEDDDKEIKRKLCPECKTPIVLRSCQRYRNIVRDIQNSIKNVQQEFLQNSQELLGKKSTLIDQWLYHKYEFKRLDVFNVTYLKQLEKLLENLSRIVAHSDAQKIIAYENSIQLLIKVVALYPSVPAPQVSEFDRHVFESMRQLIEWLEPSKRRFFGSEVEQVENEMKRIKHILDFIKAMKQIPLAHLPKWRLEATKLLHYHDYPKGIQDATVKAFKKLKLGDNIPGLGITELERSSIVKAMGLRQGHWYKCPNGHPYVITECGGAMEESNCNTCGARIGGGSHRLVDGNAVATVMDGARHAAWSEQGFDMRNFNFDNLL